MTPRFLPSTLAIIGLLVLCITAPSTAEAHDFEPERELLVQVFAEHVDILVVYTEAPGERTDLFRAQYGLNLGGEVGDIMRELARRAIVPRMLDGLQFEVKGERPRTGEPEVEFRDHDSRLKAAAFVRYELDELAEGKERTMIIRAKDQSFLPTPSTVYGGDGLRIVDESTDGGEPPLVNTFQLYRGKEVETTFKYSAPTSDTP